MAFIEDLGSLISAASLGVIGGVNGTIFYTSVAKIPDLDGPYISIIATGGYSPKRIHNNNTKPDYRQPTAQIVVRAKNPVVAWARVEAILALIFPVRNRVVGSTFYRDIHILGEPFDLGMDGPGRIKYSFNVLGEKRPA